MAIPTNRNSGLELEVTNKGRLRFKVDGKVIPATTVEVFGDVAGGTVHLQIPARFVLFATEPEHGDAE